MNREQMALFLAAAPIRREDPESVRQRLVAALESMTNDLVSMGVVASMASVNYTTLWHRVKNIWKLQPVERVPCRRGGPLGMYDRKKLLELLKNQK